ncbi:MAG TPA: hypothetical protein VMC07_03045 [Candidatus Omnitrophota bacterium]|nr:hypothetical protein [Candidatus Omnitrophota bacterium]
MAQQKVTNKEKKIFWAGVSAGLIGGLVGNIYTGYLFAFSNDIKSKINPLTDAIGVLILTIIFFGILFFINYQINKKK